MLQVCTSVKANRGAGLPAMEPEQQLQQLFPQVSVKVIQATLSHLDIAGDINRAAERLLAQQDVVSSAPKQLSFEPDKPGHSITIGHTVKSSSSTFGRLLPSETPRPFQIAGSSLMPITQAGTPQTTKLAGVKYDYVPPRRASSKDREAIWVVADVFALMKITDGTLKVDETMLPCLPVHSNGSRIRHKVKVSNRSIWPDADSWLAQLGCLAVPESTDSNLASPDFTFSVPIPISADARVIGPSSKRQKAAINLDSLPDSLQSMLKLSSPPPAYRLGSSSGRLVACSTPGRSASTCSSPPSSDTGQSSRAPSSALASPLLGATPAAGEEGALQIVHSMFQGFEASVIADVLSYLGGNADAAIDQLTDMQNQRDHVVLPSLGSELSEDSASVVSSANGMHPHCDGLPAMRDEDASSDYSFKGLTLEHKVRILRQYHRDIPRGEIVQLLQQNAEDLDTVTSIIVTNQDLAAFKEREQQQNNDELLAAAQHAEELRAKQEQQDEVFARQVQWELQQSAAAAPRDLAPPADAGSLDAPDSSGWQLVNHKAQANLANLQRSFPQVPADAAEAVLQAHGNDLGVAKQVLRDSDATEAVPVTVQTAMPGRPSNSSVEAQPHAAADKWEFNVVPRDNFKPSRPPHRRDASYAANKALYDHERKNALKFREGAKTRRHEAFAAARRGDHEQARKLRDEAYSFEHQAKRLDREAGQTIARLTNRSNVVYFSVDLHGQYVEAAKKLVEEHIQLAEHTVRTTQGPASLKIITGKGLHSIDNIPRILPAVQTMLRLKQLRFTEYPGSIQVEFRHASDDFSGGNVITQK